MSQAVVEAVRAPYPPTLSEQDAAFICNEVAWRMNGNSAIGPYGLHQKSGSNYQGVALDIVGIRDTGQLIDILGSVNGSPGGFPQWIPVPGILQWTPVRLEWLPGGPEPPTPPDDLEARVAALESRVARLESRFRSAGEIMAGL